MTITEDDKQVAAAFAYRENLAEGRYSMGDDWRDCVDGMRLFFNHQKEFQLADLCGSRNGGVKEVLKHRFATKEQVDALAEMEFLPVGLRAEIYKQVCNLITDLTWDNERYCDKKAGAA
jgi:hypothetical protein